MANLLEQLKLQIKIIQVQLQILLLKRKLTVPNLPIPQKIIIHHGGGFLGFSAVNDYHRELWGFKSSLGFYIGYGYFIDRGGIVYQGRADNETQAHTKGMNKLSIGICLMGNGEQQDFTTNQYDSLYSLVGRLRKKYDIPKSEIWGHRNFSQTACPSDKLYSWILDYKIKKVA